MIETRLNVDCYDPVRWVHDHAEILREAILIRTVEEALLDLYRAGELHGTVHTCVGQELIGPALARAATKDDLFISNHRGHGHFLAATGDVYGLIAEIMARTDGVCDGVGGSQHLRSANFLSNGIQGGMAPVAAGLALAAKLRNSGSIVVAFIGDGTLGEGVLYEAFNICAIWQLPVLFVLENNHYAQSTCMQQTFAGSVRQRVLGFGLEYIASDTWRLDHLVESTADAVQRVRNGQRPCLLEIETYRLRPHSKGDDNRADQERTSHLAKDVLERLTNDGYVDDQIASARTTVAEAIARAREAAVLESPPRTARFDRSPQYVSLAATPAASGKRINELIYDHLCEYLADEPRALLIGEDIEYQTPWTPKAYGGAFKVTKDLSDLFAGRVRNTPISEAAITGVGTGLALGGMRPIVEIMFGDFVSLAFDQLLNHATKFPSMYGREVEVPLVVRTPMGGRRGYGPTHSQSLERHLLGIENLTIVALNSRIDPGVLYRAIHDHMRCPTLVVEHKLLYTQPLRTGAPPGFAVDRTDDLFPTVRIRPADGSAAQITIACYGSMFDEVERAVTLAFEEHEIRCEAFCFARIHPLDPTVLIESLRRTRRLLTVEEGGSIAGWGAEVLAAVLERRTTLAGYGRMGCDGIIPSSVRAEHAMTPNADAISKQIRRLTHER